MPNVLHLQEEVEPDGGPAGGAAEGDDADDGAPIYAQYT
jgi:hypothetical protein